MVSSFVSLNPRQTVSLEIHVHNSRLDLRITYETYNLQGFLSMEQLLLVFEM